MHHFGGEQTFVHCVYMTDLYHTIAEDVVGLIYNLTLKKLQKTFFLSFWSVYPLLKYMSKICVMSNLNRGKGLQDEYSKWPPNASIYTNILYKLYCFSVAFYCDKLEYDNVLQV